MKAKRFWPLGLLVLAGLITAPASVLAAESYDNCTGFIDSVPATITTQGVWCLRKDLSTAMTSGNAITIATNNVTIDCNGFKVGGLAAGSGSTAVGIFAGSRQNTTVRQCAIRGFFDGVHLSGAGHLVEDNRLDQNLSTGIRVDGENNRVQRNAVYDTGGSTNGDTSHGIYAEADVIDNTVAGVFAVATDTYPRGIRAAGGGNEVRGNRVRALAVAGGGWAHGIGTHSPGMTVADNRVSAQVVTNGFAIIDFSRDTFCTGNTVVKFYHLGAPYVFCDASYGNLSLP